MIVSMFQLRIHSHDHRGISVADEIGHGSNRDFLQRISDEQVTEGIRGGFGTKP